MGRRLIRPGAAPSAPWHYRDALEDYGQTATPDWRATDWLSELKRIEVDGIPFNYVDVGSGERDSIIPIRDADEFERLIEDSRKVVMKDTGHISMAERPQAFNDLLVDFLAETGPAEEKEPAEGESQAA